MAQRQLILSVLAALTLVFAPWAQTQEHTVRRAGDPLIPICRFAGALCGYVNAADETVIAPKYDWAGRFVEGRARVRLGGLYGFIDDAGREIVPLIYDAASDYWHGVAQVRRENRTALIDRDGETVIPAKWDRIFPLDGRRFLVSRVFPYQLKQPMTLRFDGGGWGQWWVLDQSTGGLTELPGRRIGFPAPENRTRLWVSDDTQHSLFDSSGQQLSGPYRQVGDLRDGVIQVATGHERILIDLDGNVVGPVPYPPNVRETADKWNLYHVTDMVESPVRHFDRKWGYVDADGAAMIEARFDYAYAFEGDVALVSLDGDELLINRSGAIIGRADGCQDGLRKERLGDRFVILGPDGEPINDETYHYVRLICDAPAIVMPDAEHEGHVRANGSLIGDRYFWRASPFYDGVAGVFVREGHWGIIDETGAFILPPTEIVVSVGSAGHNRTYIDFPDGRVLLDRSVAERLARDPTPLLRHREGPIACGHDGVTISEKDGIVTYADRDGTPLFRGAFDYAGCFGGGRAIVAMPERQGWCEIDKRGHVLKDSCHCWQPIAIIEFDVSPRDGPECYPHGISILRELGVGRTLRDAWMSP